MKGTEKQIKWATEISENVIRTLESVIETIKSDPQFDPTNPIHSGNIADCEARISAVKDCEYAGDIIDCFKDIRFNGNLNHDFGEIHTVYNVRTPYTDGQHKLLMK